MYNKKQKHQQWLFWILILISFVVFSIYYYNQTEVCRYTTVGGERMKICTYK